MDAPRVVIAGVRGGAGKTLMALGVTAAWRAEGRAVAPFKKGPDYIDAAWLTAAAGRPCRNLDLYLMPPDAAARSFAAAASGGDVSVIEGNRGLHDGLDAAGSASTGELAKLLDAPVVLTVDCTKATRTIAAIVLGCQRLDPDVKLAGVILNRVGGGRHEAVIRQAVEAACGVPVLGAVPRLAGPLFPERHLGLVPPAEHDERGDAIRAARDAAQAHLDLAALWDVARQAPAVEAAAPADAPPPPAVRVGVFRDPAFEFYYPDNLEALARAGAGLVEISPTQDRDLPDVDALYIGGGFPETLAPTLAQNTSFLAAVRRAAEHGMPIYAECGGAVFLGEKLHYDGRTFDLAGVLPATFGFGRPPRGHGYVELDVARDNPFYCAGERLRGHEFHYTYLESSAAELEFAFRVRRGHGFDGCRDGLCRNHVLACYTHVHALGTPAWAPGVVAAAGRYNRAGP